MAKKKARPLSRPTGFRDYRAVCWVSTEGKTEQDYLKMDVFRGRDTTLRFPEDVRPNKRDPEACLARLERNLDAAPLGPKDEAWVVVDVDRWDAGQFEELMRWEDRDRRHHVAISNPKFEVFVVMHFGNAKGCTTPQEVDRAMRASFPGYPRRKRLEADAFDARQVEQAIRTAESKRGPGRFPGPGATDVHLLAKRLLTS